MRPAPSRLIIDSIDFETASVSGTFSSSTTLTPGTSFSALIADRMRLVPAEIVARADIDDADGEVGRGERALDGAQTQAPRPPAPKAVVFRRERREIAVTVIMILGRAALRGYAAATQVNGSKDHAAPRKLTARGASQRLILWRRRLIVSRGAPQLCAVDAAVTGAGSGCPPLASRWQTGAWQSIEAGPE